jgi:tetratricopeptide (TPR) repeat protein
MFRAYLFYGLLIIFATAARAQEGAIADPADLAFEAGRWAEAISEYRKILEENPEDRLSLLRIAQAQRELGRYEEALATLETARTVNAPEAMIDFERARNLLALGRADDALTALDAADHVGLRALSLLEEADDFDPIRDEKRFQSVMRSVRGRVYPCEGEHEASEFDFWVGDWEVRMPDGTLVGHNSITKRDGDCSVVEQWRGTAGSTGTSVSFYVPSRDQWRQVWTGSGGTLIDMSGGLTQTGEMHMEGTIEYVYPERVVAFRATWTLAEDGRVRQRMEEFDLAAQTWIVWFDGIYRRTDARSSESRVEVSTSSD